MAMIGDLVTRNNYGSAMGVFGSLWDAGHAAGPVLFGLLLLVSGYQVAWLVMALLMSCALVVFLGAGRRCASPGASPPAGPLRPLTRAGVLRVLWWLTWCGRCAGRDQRRSLSPPAGQRVTDSYAGRPGGVRP